LSGFLQQLRTQGVKIWQQLDRWQQISVAGLGLGVIVLLVLLVNWARTPEYAVAFSGLSEADAAAVVAKLRDSTIPYRLEDGGRTISVPANKVAEVRLQMASENVLKGSGVGFELFDQNSFGVTDFVQKINYQRALEGELSRTIDSLDAVESSRVHIVIPQPSLYTEDQKEATASVVLKLKTGRSLTDSQIRGITNLVAGSVEGLKPQGVTIIDTNGQVLSDQGADGSKDGYRATASQLEMQRTFEKEMEDNLRNWLGAILGPQKAAVKVSADMNWDQVSSDSETYSPAGQAGSVRSTHDQTEKYIQTSPGAGGIPGSDSNIPTYQEEITTTNRPYYERNEVTTNYELSKTVQHLVQAPGSLKRLSVAVVLDKDAVPDQALVDQISTLVSTAAGLDAKRGDMVTVTAMPFDKGALAQDRAALEEAKRWDLYFQIAKIAGMIIAPLLLLLILRRFLRRSQPALAVVGQPALQGRVALVTEMANGLAKEAEPEELEAPRPPLLVEDPHKKMVREQIQAMAKNNPEVLVQLIHTWMEDDKRGRR